MRKGFVKKLFNIYGVTEFCRGCGMCKERYLMSLFGIIFIVWIFVVDELEDEETAWIPTQVYYLPAVRYESWSKLPSVKS